MSWESEILALNPVRFARLDENVGSTEITDISVNASHGVYHADSVHGQASPIETDASSRSVGSRVGHFPAPEGSDLDLVNNFSLLGWMRIPDALDATLLARNGSANQSSSNWLGYNLGAIHWRTSPEFGTTHFLNAAITPIVGQFYFVAGVRNGTVLRLYVNAEIDLGDEDIGFQAGPYSYPNYSNSSWKIGNAMNSVSASPGIGNFQFGDLTDEIVIFDYALTEVQLQTVYAAALNSLSLAGFSNVISSAVLYSDLEPDPISFPFRHNWSDPLIERLSFGTAISTAAKGYEQANAQRIKPRREIEISQLLRDDYERRMLHAKLATQQNRKWFIPILDDRDRLAVPVSSGVQVIPVDPLYKDYEIGSYVGLRQLNNAGRITHWEELQISGLEDSEVQTATETQNSYTAPEVYPVRRAIISASQSLRGHTDAVEDTTITAHLLAEDEKAVPHRIVPWTPSITYKSHEVFDPTIWRSNDWSENREYGIDRIRSDVDFEVGAFSVEADSLAAGESFTYRVPIEGKQAQAELLGWFYARAGAHSYLWVPTMQRDLELVSLVSSALTVEGHNYFDNFAGGETRRNLAFVYHDNTMVLRQINSAALSGSNEVLTLSGGASLTNLRSISYLLFCRLDGDTLEIAKITDTKARYAWRFKEMLSSPS